MAVERLGFWDSDHMLQTQLGHRKINTCQPKLNNFWTFLFLSSFPFIGTQVDTLSYHLSYLPPPDTSIRAVDSTQKLPFLTNAPRSRRQTESRLASLTPILTPFQRQHKGSLHLLHAAILDVGHVKGSRTYYVHIHDIYICIYIYIDICIYI